QPAHILAGSRCLMFPTIEDPARIFAYFYEGNDLQDNVAFGRKVAQAFGRSDRDAIDTYLSDVYGSFAAWRCHLHLFDVGARMARFFYEYYIAGVEPFACRHTPRGDPVSWR